MFKKPRKGADKAVAPPTSADSIEAMRRRARHRLIGAVVLVLAAVIGFPILFDTQPRPVAVDIPIEIPDRNKAKPLAAAPAAAPKVTPESAIITEAKEEAPPAAAPAAPAAPVVAAAPPAAAAPAPVTPPAPAAPRAAASESRPVVAEKKPEPKPEAKVEPRTAAAADEAAKARALLEGKAVQTVAAAGERFVVQVGAFAEADKAKMAQMKLQRAGLKNYTNVAETRDGKRIRVRAGPFASRAEAAEAAEKIKGLDLPAAILTL